MKSRLSNIARLLKYGYRPILMLVLAMGVTSLSLHAQEIFQVDPQYSIARLSLGSSTNTSEIGLARISGEVIFEPGNPADPVVNLKMAPDDEPRADYAEMSFASQRSIMHADGKLLDTGELVVTHVERSVTMEPNEDYAGAQYGEPLAHTETREVTLVFSDPREPAARDNAMQFSGTTSVSREVFPQLVNALAPGNWPTVVADNVKCEMPSTVGDDYSGPTCTGTVIAAVTNSVVMVGTA